MKNIIWRFIAKQLARPAVADWIINRAPNTPYDWLAIVDGKSIVRVLPEIELRPGDHWYMRRWWLLCLGPLQIRLHHIMAADIGRDFHDHPWPFRTFILRGGYLEQREGIGRKFRTPGHTAAMGRGEFHRIDRVAPGGAWTLFATWGKRKGWGFKQHDGRVIPHEEYGS